MGEWLCSVLGRGYRVQARELHLGLLRPGPAPPGPVRRHRSAPLRRRRLVQRQAEGPRLRRLVQPRARAGEQAPVGDRAGAALADVHAEFSLVYQPIFDLATGAIRSFEALARWEHGELGTIRPSEFIPITEQINVIEEISDALLGRRRGAGGGLARHGAPLLQPQRRPAVLRGHLGAAHPRHPAVARPGARPAASRSPKPRCSPISRPRANLDRLRAARARIVLDDFGAGYASISYQEMKFDAIKLDGSLVTGEAVQRRRSDCSRACSTCARRLNVPCVAEHIEEAGQLALLKLARLPRRPGLCAVAAADRRSGAREMAATKLVPDRRGGRAA